MTGVLPPYGHLWRALNLYSTPIAEQTLRQGTPMASDFARPLPPRRCGLRPCQGLYPVSCALQVGNSVPPRLPGGLACALTQQRPRPQAPWGYQEIEGVPPGGVGRAQHR
jgi:hypothetical protein